MTEFDASREFQWRSYTTLVILVSALDPNLGLGLRLGPGLNNCLDVLGLSWRAVKLMSRVVRGG